MQKYVVSTTLQPPLVWQNSTLISGDVPEEIKTLKTQQSGNIVIMGSGELIQMLIHHNLIDRYILLIHPLVLGTGRRLFRDSGTSLKLVSAKATPNGVIVATYEP